MDEQLRIGDAERDRAADELGEHYAQGRLTTEEHAERLDRIWAARTRGELVPLFRDLPGHQPPGGTSPLPVDRPAYRPRTPGPLVAVLAVLLVLTVVTHVPLILLGLLVVLVVSTRRRRRWQAHRWPL